MTKSLTNNIERVSHKRVLAAIWK